MNVLAIDAGSSSLKYAVYAMQGAAETLLASGAGAPDASITDIVASLTRRSIAFQAAGHRIVFGGAHARPCSITRGLLDELRGYAAIDPMHLPLQIAIVEQLACALPDLPQIACFDTAFHAGMPDVAQRLPLAQTLDPLLKRYGYHGLSYEYIASTIDWGRYPRAIIAHLGNGASLAAVSEGRCIETTMGFTPLGGIVMSTRSGDMDPGVLLYLMRERGMTPAQLDALLAANAGLRGVFGRSGDMRDLLANADRDPACDLAVRLFVYTAAKFTGALAAALGGADLLVFTGGIGENAAPVRDAIAAQVAFLGARVIVTPANESLVIARHVRGVLER